MAHFRKKPIVIEAYQFRIPSDPRPPWFAQALNDGRVWYQGGPDPYFTIKTLEGEMRASLNDWIIRGVKGELYPIKDEIFRETYEPADGGARRLTHPRIR
ncbi:hypothetical protein DEM27_10475 [Metarhizobium album]|uniref:Uncharacterized protein n=1 Tax=Metarhizobium album TaxID=2182425 RepID=A0A2U2DU81_9HYPH|nr:hypothetical protein [Rhizobium album]PWE56779.1 hypothetical protein DEM27_10475 [Rhizobium album]